MKVLFVSSGKKKVVGEVVRNQGESLQKEGISIDYFLIKPGISGYIMSIPKIRKVFKSGNYDIVHAHYSLSAFSASLAGSFPIVVSLMGSDVHMSFVFRMVTRFFIKARWDAIIVKSKELKDKLKITRAFVLPNGVDITKFRSIPMDEAKIKIGYPKDKKIVAFIASPQRNEKNYQLAQEAFKLLNNVNAELKLIYDAPNETIPYYINASDVLLLTSKWEGSPNIIKEAMACNCPIVSTDVGDVSWVVGNTAGCFLTSFDPIDVADKMGQALAFNSRTTGRERIFELGLNSTTVVPRIVSVYREVIKGKTRKDKMHS